MAVTSIELSISRVTDGHAATLVAELPNSRAQLASDVSLAIGAEALRALEIMPDVYGAALTAKVFPAGLREAWPRARGLSEGRATPLRLRLTLDGADEALHALLWEILRDPLTHLPLARGEAVRLARYLPSASLADVEPPPRPDLRAVVAVAAPPAVPPVDVEGIAGAAMAGLADIPSAVLDGREGRPLATLPNLTACLRDGAPILFLACHGALVDGEPYLWLEQAGPGPYRPVAGPAFVEALAQLATRPLLIVLAACQGAGTSYEVLRAVGPLLARAGVGAVLAMREQIPQETVAALLPPLFAELRRDGEIDRALAAARGPGRGAALVAPGALATVTRRAAVARGELEAGRARGRRHPHRRQRGHDAGRQRQRATSTASLAARRRTWRRRPAPAAQRGCVASLRSIAPI